MRAVNIGRNQSIATAAQFMAVGWKALEAHGTAAVEDDRASHSYGRPQGRHGDFMTIHDHS